MNTFLRNSIASLYNLVSTPVAATRDALAERLQSVRNAASLLYTKTKEKLGYGLRDIVEHEAALNGAYRSFRSPGLPKTDVDTYVEKVTPSIKTLVEQQVRELSSVKMQLTMWIKWKKQEEMVVQLDEEDMEDWSEEEKHTSRNASKTLDIIVEKPFNSKMTEVFQASDIEGILHRMFADIKTQIENPALPKSGFTLDSIIHLDINFHQLTLTRGSSYMKLPSWITKKKAVINPKNNDEECFKWAVIATLHHEEIENDPQRISKLKPFVDRYNWDSLKFPTSIKDIGKFEENNVNVAVNVLYINHQGRGTSIDAKQGKIGILRRSEFNMSRQRVVNLLLISDGEKRHYTCIKNISRLLSSLNSKGKRLLHYCLNCLNGFQTEIGRDAHYVNCIDHEAVKIEMPKEEDKYVQYHDGQNQFKVPFCMYADFESILKPMNEQCKEEMKRLKNEQNGQSYTERINRHVPSGWGVMSKFAFGDVPNPLTTYRGKDCVEEFINHIMNEAKRLYTIFPEQPMIPLTDVLEREYDEAEKCHICMKSFDDSGKVRDHCHYTGLYRGAAHNKCNLKYKVPKHIPIVFHNLSGYDAHLFIRELGKKFNTQDIGCIAENKEKYISFNVKINVAGEDGKPKKIELRFIDSCRFMSSSLDALSSNLSDDQCKNLRWFYKEDDVFQLMRRKGVYPYEYMDSWGRFEETTLPSKEAFYSKLNMSDITDKNYEHAQQVWNRITPAGNQVTLGDYHDVYLVTDVLLLPDVFETFRDVCLKHYKLDPAHFYTTPGLAWQAALKYTNIKLELLTDYNMLLMFEKGIRGGLTQAVHRYAKANNKYMEEQYNLEKYSSFLQYLDANNLYGWAMIQELPIGGFKWMSNVEEFTAEKITKLLEENNHGYLFEVDVDYPEELHAKHNDLPFMPEKMMIDRVEKLVPNLFHKKEYVIHIRALDQALKHGLILTKVHRVIRFKQSAWLKPYIDLNTQLRTEATNEFEKDFFKLMNNSVFGKTMENIRHHRDMKLVTNEKKYKKLVMKPNFKDARKFSGNLMGVEVSKTKIVMKKPVYLGQAILDLSKIVMYEFHYDYMVRKYMKNAQLCYMDTDSFVYHIKTEDFYKDIADDVENRFDTSGYRNDRPLPIDKNKKIIGLMKDELGGKIMTEFVALRAKLYAYKKLDVKKPEDKRCKGVKKCVVEKSLSFDDYKKCLDSGVNVYREQLLFQNKDHEIFTSRINKIALNRDDDKRVVQLDQISILARGHISTAISQ